jgi:hypothetical protein
MRCSVRAKEIMMSKVRRRPNWNRALSVKDALHYFLELRSIDNVSLPQIGIRDSLEVSWHTTGRELYDTHVASDPSMGLVRTMGEIMDFEVLAIEDHEIITMTLFPRRINPVHEFDCFVTDLATSYMDGEFPYYFGVALAMDVHRVELAVFPDDNPQMIALLIAGLKYGGVELQITFPAPSKSMTIGSLKAQK